MFKQPVGTPPDDEVAAPELGKEWPVSLMEAASYGRGPGERLWVAGHEERWSCHAISASRNMLLLGRAEVTRRALRLGQRTEGRS